MRFHELGSAHNPTVLMLHGAGLSWWAYREVGEQLAGQYHVVLPVIDGYAEAAEEPFESIQASAQKLVEFIRTHFGGRVFALGGCSLGAQIAAEALGLDRDIAQFAVLESALVCPVPGAAALAGPMVRMSYGLIRQRWFARLQARELCVPDALFETYYADSLKLSRDSLLRTLQSNATYRVQPQLADTHARTLILVGGREVAAERRSAQLLHQTVAGSTLYEIPGMKHGEWSLLHPREYAEALLRFFAGAPVGDRG